MEENRAMILAGEIGATRTRLAAFEKEGSRLQLVVEETYLSLEHGSLSEIIAAFIKAEGIPVHQACFGVAGPVRRGRSKISNLPWVIDARDLAKQLQLDAVGMINDLEAYAYGIDGLDSKDFVTLNEGSEDAEGNRAVIPSPARAGTPISHPETPWKWSCWPISRRNTVASAASGFFPGRESRTSTTFFAILRKRRSRNG